MAAPLTLSNGCIAEPHRTLLLDMVLESFQDCLSTGRQEDCREGRTKGRGGHGRGGGGGGEQRMQAQKVHLYVVAGHGSNTFLLPVWPFPEEP